MDITNHSKMNTPRQIAIAARNSMDTDLPPKMVGIKEYQRLLEYKTAKPTVGLLAEREAFLFKNIKSPSDCYINKKIMDKHKRIVYLKNVFEKNVKRLYPQTRLMRMFIIESGRLDLDKVTKSKGYNLFDKLRFMLRIF